MRVLVVGGTRGLGRALARAYVERGAEVVVAGRDEERARAAAAEIGAAGGLALDLAEPESIGPRLAALAETGRVVLSAIERDANSVRAYDVARALRLTTLKLVGYTEVVHQLAARLPGDGSILLFGGLAKERPYPGSTTVTTVNGGVTALARTLALELAPVRVNAIHPGIVGDTEAWAGREEALERVLARTPAARLVQTDDVVAAALALLENPALNGVNLPVDGGWLLT